MQYNKVFLGIFLFLSPIAYACYSDRGCPKGNVCVKTGYLAGICLSQAQPLNTYSTPVTGQTVTPGVKAPATGTQTTTTTHTPTVTTPSSPARVNPMVPTTPGGVGVKY
jgi:hypothetical protein